MMCGIGWILWLAALTTLTFQLTTADIIFNLFKQNRTDYVIDRFKADGCSDDRSYCQRYGADCACAETLDGELWCDCPANGSDDGGGGKYKDNWCTTNGSYCQVYGADCYCTQSEGTYHCSCPSALEYTLRLAAGIAIILLVGLTIMLAFSLYRRAVVLRRRSRSGHSGRSDSVSSVSSSDYDPPPLYNEINVVSSPSLDYVDSEKLPTYDEAIEYLNGSTLLVLNTEIFLRQSCEPSTKGESCSTPPSSPAPTSQPPSYQLAISGDDSTHAPPEEASEMV